MELEKMARQLGAAIQQDEAYLNFEKARLANEADEELNDLMGKIRLIQMSYQVEAAKDEPDEDKMNGFNQEFQGVYSQIMANKNMQEYEKARQAVDDMMNYITGILGLCVNGEDPRPAIRELISMIAAANALRAAAAIIDKFDFTEVKKWLNYHL